MSAPSPRHEPVLLQEVLEGLEVRPGGLFVDGTVGLGGHAEAILEKSAPEGRLIGTDRDPQALDLSRERLARFGERVELHHSDWRGIPAVLGPRRADGILLDLGVSSLQLDSPERGFSFAREGPLDMRMDTTRGETAAEVVNHLPEKELADVIYQYGEERASRHIAHAIALTRARTPFATTTALAAVVRKAAPRRGHFGGIDPATRTFQALRIHVNGELDGLRDAVTSLATTLAPRGRLCVISFHSLEDREVKYAFRGLGAERGFTVVTRKPLVPTADECARNPRARSAKLRVLAAPEAA